MKRYFHRYRHNSLQDWYLGLLSGFAGVLDGLVTILSGATICSGFELRVVSYRAKQSINRQRKSK